MPTIRQLIQTSPAKANELFGKLVETSGNAVKTRERLFSELKEGNYSPPHRCERLNKISSLAERRNFWSDAGSEPVQ